MKTTADDVAAVDCACLANMQRKPKAVCTGDSSLFYLRHYHGSSSNFYASCKILYGVGCI
nr:hypothetical protein [Mucilaginibacter sp. X4EP1]MCS3813298.1 hypothetical protein [Mucilaginibacter sp. X4EP1]